MNDEALTHAIAEELEWAPHVDAARIHISVHDGVVRLQGEVATLAEKKAANRVVWHLQGVTGVRDDIAVRLAENQRHPDEELLRRARQVLLWDSLVPGGQIEVRVENGTITLTGMVNEAFQRVEAEERVQHLAGAIRVDNQLTIRAKQDVAADLHKKVRRGLERHSELDSSRIAVNVNGSLVTLSGMVPSFTQRRIAENVAWAVSGVSDVVDLMRVNH
jgi:osmotically-inducible protein OsmY